MRVFLTGATGVIGRRAIPLLLSAGHDVTAVGRSPEKRAVLERQGVKAVALDPFDRQAARRALAGHEAVINLATAIPPMSRSFMPGAWRETSRIRSEASANLTDASHAEGTKRFVQESFAGAYPDSGDNWIDERVPLKTAPYNQAVRDAENAVDRFAQEGGAGVVLRFAFFYGPSDEFTVTAIKAIRRGWMPIFGSPEAFFSMVSHDDAASAVVAALGVPAGIYNVVESDPQRRRELANAIASMLGVKPPRFLPAWVAKLGGSLGETIARSLRISNRKLRQASTWEPRLGSPLESWRAIIEQLGPGVKQAARG